MSSQPKSHPWRMLIKLILVMKYLLGLSLLGYFVMLLSLRFNWWPLFTEWFTLGYPDLAADPGQLVNTLMLLCALFLSWLVFSDVVLSTERRDRQ